MNRVDPHPELHIMLSDDVNVVFHPPTFTLLKAGRQAAEILQDYQAGYTLEQIAERRGCTSNDSSTLLQTLREKLDNQPAIAPVWANPLTGTLTLVISRDCNLRCKYCYADGGAYHKRRQLMTPETAIRALDLFINSKRGFQFDEIVFFGGEPTMNLPLIRTVAEYVRQAVVEGRIARRPHLGLVTNGTRVTDEFCALVNEYDLIVTVSLDGPPEINDQLRIDAGGRSTFWAVVRGIRRLQKATNNREPRMIECTVTKKHLEAGYTYESLVHFFIDTIGIRQHHIVPVNDWADYKLEFSEEETTSWEVDMQTAFVNALGEGNLQLSKLGRRAVHMLNAKKFNPYLCVAGSTSITVDADGALYPCYQLNNDLCYVGNISDPDVLNSERFEGMVKSFVENSKIQHPLCRTCWIRGLCTGCFGHMYLLTGSPHQRVDSICARRKLATEKLLMDLVRLRTDEKRWQRAIQTAKAVSAPMEDTLI